MRVLSAIGFVHAWSPTWTQTPVPGTGYWAQVAPWSWLTSSGGQLRKHPHITDPANITCNSMVTAADKGVSAFNRSYGFCALHMKNMACPYKDCVHGLVTDESQTENAHGSPVETMES